MKLRSAVLVCIAVLAPWKLVVAQDESRNTDPAASARPFVHPLFSPHTVLQRDKKVPVWGWSQPSTKITVSINGQSTSTVVAESGKWVVRLGPLEAGGPYLLQIDGTETVTIEDVLIGDVWICSGQSNMEWPVRLSNNADEEIATADHPKMRLFTVPKRISNSNQQLVDGQWSICNPQTIANFSAVGYYFGRELHRELDVPIGLIHTSWGGTIAEAWTSGEALSTMEDFRETVAHFRAAAADQPVGENPNVVTVLYNGMLAPLTPYGIKGAIWYQGESNASRPTQYRRLLPTMIHDWRSRFEQGDFPFFIVQLANFMKRQEQPVESGWAELREAQRMTAARDPKVGLAVITDIGEANDIHPRDKQDVGKRLALSALSIAYKRDVVHSGPTYKDMSIEGSTLRINFDNVGSGLVARGGVIRGFAVAEQDKKRFVWADAVIEGDSVVVSSDEIAEPLFIRYNWANNPIGNLFNREGLPAAPFRTDRDRR
jgi:sialate O-acetylesterase